MDNKIRLIKCLEENGIAVLENGKLNDLDSLKFISAIISIEEEFSIQIPDAWFAVSALQNLNDFEAAIKASK
ncbi:hypothetical protein FACS1894193_00980 [Bacilli bacterium]|nr:hypothetical protein FACS1894193_00980 [Bacilli bacterium]